MAGNGPPPSPRRRRRNADTFAHGAVTVDAAPGPDAGDVAGPPLPYERKYLMATRVWYATWRGSPQAQAFEATDWQRLHMLAPIVDAYWRGAAAGEPRKDLLAEIRLNETLLGATHVDRLRGRITVERRGGQAAPRAAAGADVADLAARRRRLADGA